MTVVIVIIAFLSGVYAVTGQAFLVREFLVVFQGNEMSLAVLLAGWLSGVALGAAAARSKVLKGISASYSLVLALAAWVVLFPLSVMSVRVVRTILDLPVGSIAPLSTLALVAFLLVGPVAAFAGFVFVTLAALAEGRTGARSPVGIIYVPEAAGGVLGGVLFTFVFAGRLSPFTVAFAAYVVMGVANIAFARAAAGAKALTRHGAATLVIGTSLLALSGLTLLGTGRDHVLQANTSIVRMRSIGPGFLVDERETPYQNLSTVMLGGQYTVYGNGEPLTTFPEWALDEREAFTVLTEHPAPASVLVISGGPSYISSVLAYSVDSVDYLEIDPAVLDAARPLLSDKTRQSLDSPRVAFHAADARAFLKAADSPYDVIIVRAPSPSTLMLNRLYTAEFFREAKSRLAPGGVLVIPVTLADGYISGEVGRYAGTIYQTLLDVFPYVLATPGTSSIFIASASPGVLTSSIAELSARFTARDIHSELFPIFFADVFPPERTESLNATLASLPPALRNTDWAPSTYAANLSFWARFSGSTLASWVLSASGARAYKVFAVLGVLAIIGVLPAFTRRTIHSAAPVAVLYTGFFAMSMTVILLYSFQVMCGYLYEWIGVLTAAFIGGLAIGGAVGVLTGASKKAFMLTEAILVLLPLAVLVFLSCCGSLSPDSARWLVLIVALASGSATGLEFPIAASVLTRAGADASTVASRLQVRDQLGACMGAVLAGVVLVPAMGIYWSLVFLAALKVCTFAAVARAADGSHPFSTAAASPS